MRVSMAGPSEGTAGAAAESPADTVIPAGSSDSRVSMAGASWAMRWRRCRSRKAANGGRLAGAGASDRSRIGRCFPRRFGCTGPRCTRSSRIEFKRINGLPAQRDNPCRPKAPVAGSDPARACLSGPGAQHVSRQDPLEKVHRSAGQSGARTMPGRRARKPQQVRGQRTPGTHEKRRPGRIRLASERSGPRPGSGLWWLSSVGYDTARFLVRTVACVLR